MHKSCWHCSKRIAWSNLLGICRDCVKAGKTEKEQPASVCNHCGGQLVDGMCDAPLSNAD